MVVAPPVFADFELAALRVAPLPTVDDTTFLVALGCPLACLEAPLVSAVTLVATGGLADFLAVGDLVFTVDLFFTAEWLFTVEWLFTGGGVDLAAADFDALATATTKSSFLMEPKPEIPSRLASLAKSALDCVLRSAVVIN